MTAFSASTFDRPKWQTAIIFALAFWLSASLVLDLVIMPGLYSAGMMTQPGFASAGYSIFWVFNRIELLCAALVLTGALVLYKTQTLFRPGVIWAIALPLFLLLITLVYTYELTPAISALGLQLDWFTATETPASMTKMHEGYGLLELLKLAASAALLSFYYRTQK
jgi:hypothetical protein